MIGNDGETEVLHPVLYNPNLENRARIFNPLRHHYTSLPDAMVMSKKCYIKGPFYLEREKRIKVTATATGIVERALLIQDTNNKRYSLLIDNRDLTGPIEGKDINYGELLDIYNGRYKRAGELTNKLGKIGYYGFVQTLFFAGLQSAAFAFPRQS